MPQTKLEDFYIQFSGNTANLHRAITEVNQSIGRLERAAETRAARLEGIFARVGKAVRSALIPAALLAATFALRRAISFPVAAFREYQDALIGVGKVTDLQGVKLEELGESIEALGASIASIKTTQLLAITESAARLGIRGSSNLRKFTSAVAGLQATTNITGEESTEALARLLNLTQTDTTNIDRVAASIVALGNTFAATETEIVHFTTQLSRNLVRFQPTIQEVLGLGTAFQAIGARPESASTAIGRVFGEINRIIRDSSAEIRQISELTGLSIEELQSRVGDDLFGIFTKLIGGLNRLQAEGGNVDEFFKAINVPSVRAISNISALANNVELLQHSLDVSSVSFEENTALQDEMAARLTTLSSKFVQLQNAAAEAFKSSGLSDSLEGLVELLTNWLSDFSTQDIVAAARTLNQFAGSLNEVAEAGALSEQSVLNLQRQLTTGALSPDTLSQLLAVNRYEIENLQSEIGQAALDLSDAISGRGINLSGDANFPSALARADQLFIEANKVITENTRKIEDLTEIRQQLYQAFQTLTEQELDDADNVTTRLLEKAIERAQELLERFTTGGETRVQVGINSFIDQEGAERQLAILQGMLITQEKLEQSGKRIQAIQDAIINEASAELIDSVQTQIRYLRERIKAQREGDDVLRRTIALQEAETTLNRKNLNFSNEELKTLADKIELRNRLTEEYRNEQRARNQTGSNRQLEREQRLQDQVVRSYIELLRQVDALRMSREAHEDVTDAIEAENQILAANIDLQSELGQHLSRQIETNQELGDEIENLEEKYKAVEEATQEVQDAFSDFASSSITELESIGDAFRVFANRIVNIWFDNVIAQIAGSSAGSGIFGAIGQVLAGGIPSFFGGGGGIYNVGNPVPDPLAFRVPGRQVGGPVDPGRLYRVGERGPEYFIPNMAGRIEPDLQEGRGTPIVINQSFNVQVTDEPEFDRKLTSVAQQAKTYADKSIPEQVRKRVVQGGRYRRDVRGGY